MPAENEKPNNERTRNPNSGAQLGRFQQNVDIKSKLEREFKLERINSEKFSQNR